MNKTMDEIAQDGPLDLMHKMRAELIMRARLRGLDDTSLEPVLYYRLWRAFGYERLGDYLYHELGIPLQRVLRWTSRAVAAGLEPAQLYNVSPVP